MIHLPEIRARWLLAQLIIAFLLPAVLFGFFWPGWIDTEVAPIPDAILFMLTYLLLVSLLYLTTKTTKHSARFPAGELSIPRDALILACLSIPLVGVSFTAIWGFFLPLSYVAPEFVSFWLLDVPPIIFWRFDQEAIVANTLNSLVMVVLAPIIEEIFFRGFLLNRWVNKYGLVKGVALSSIVFALFHYEPIGAFVFSVVLSLIYMQTRSLVGTVIVHAANNAIVILALIFVGVIEGEIATVTLREFQEAWWLGLIGAAVSIPWLTWFLRKRISGLERHSEHPTPAA